MAQLKEGSIIRKSTGDEVVATLNDIPTALSELNQDGNNRLVTAAQVTKINELNYTRAMTQAQYNALTTTEKNRTDVWYGIYK